MRLATLALITLTALTGCGASIEDRIHDEYPDYAARHGFSQRATQIDTITCNKDATRHHDGTCTIRPQGFTLTYEVPYRDNKPLWGESDINPPN